MNSRQNGGPCCIRSSLVFVLFFAATACLASVAFARQDVPGAKDHPLFPRLPGYFIARYEERPSAFYEFVAGPEQSSRVQGFYLRIDYALQEGTAKADPAEIGRRYSLILVQKGGVQVYESKNAIEPRWISRMPTGAGRQVWMEVTARSEGAQYTLTLVDGVVIEQKVSFSSVDELSRELRNRGNTMLSRINFEPGKSKLKAASEPALILIAELMKNEPALKLEVHVEPVDSPAKNGARLARKRQVAIIKFLASQGIPFSRVRSASSSELPPASVTPPDNPGVVFVKF